MENRLGSLGKREKEWNVMGMDYWLEWVERGFLKKLKCWSGYG